MRHRLIELSFKVHGGLVNESAGEPLSVVKDFDPFEYRGAGLEPGDELALMDQILFQRAPEAFHGRVVIAVAPATHAGHHAGHSQALAISFAGVLDTAIGVYCTRSAGGHRCSRAMSNADKGSVADRRALIAQPIQHRVQRSNTSATYNQPSAVGT